MIGGALERLRSVRRADVYKGEAHAAHLSRETGGTLFEYRPDYVAGGGRPVATTLSIGTTPVRTAGGAVPPFFAGLLPEGRRLTSLRRAVKTSADDELSLVLAVGRDTVGDVRVLPEGESPTSTEPLVQVKEDWASVRFQDLLSEAGIVDPVGLPGVQDKVSARMISVPVARAHERCILKIDPPEFPHLVANEAFFLALARDARMPVVEAKVVRDVDGRFGLLVTRFDRVRGPAGEAVPLACEDACQVLGRWPADKYNLTTEEVVRALADRCAARAVALRDLFRQVAFAWLTGNGDLHAKNLAIVEGADSEWRVSPAYDLPASAPYGDRTMALTVRGKPAGISRRQWLAFAADIGLPERAATSVLDHLLAKTADLEARIRAGALPFDARTNADWAAEIRNRRRLASG